MKRILTLVTLVLALCATALAQSGTGTGLVVRSSPPGAEIELTGDAYVTGVTPATFHYPLVGEYQLTLRRSGYEKYETSLVLDPTQRTQLDINLSRKTGVKAAVRSMFIPGWGQNYSEQRTKGFAFTVLFAGALVSYFVADHRFDDKNEEYVQRLTEYDDALAAGVSYAQLERRHDLMTAAQEDAYDAESVRRVTIGVVAGIWGLSVLDALFFTPRDKSVVTVQGISLTPQTESNQFGLQLTKSF